ncbi:unnamed protein product [Paramecium sonneborni]|uniref:Transmembrane protein n=1 Tax=Paramecium sonneborni TaxID=65129 RepID=A0A8S1RAF1_9CILI|nr:unnamed protein product [Paramecium sonneborni]
MLRQLLILLSYSLLVMQLIDHYICGDQIITGLEECDGNTIQYDGFFNCKYQCQPSCTAQSVQKDNVLNVQLVCDIQIQQLDLILVGSEQREDGNFSHTDSCKDFRYFRRAGCSSFLSTTNKCLKCQSGLVPFSYYCSNISGYGKVAKDTSGYFSELCDDGNTIYDDGAIPFVNFNVMRLDIILMIKNYGNRFVEIPVGYLCDTRVIFILPFKGCRNLLKIFIIHFLNINKLTIVQLVMNIIVQVVKVVITQMRIFLAFHIVVIEYLHMMNSVKYIKLYVQNSKIM